MRACLIAVAALVAGCGDRPLDRKRLYAAVTDLASVAAESRLLAVQEPRGMLASYAEGQRADLADRARTALRELDRGVEDPRLDRVRRDAAAAGAALPALVTAARPAELGASAERLAQLATETVP